MTKLADHQSSEATKLLLAGSSGAGKTSALISLVKAGYKLFIEDYDNGLDFFKNYITKNMPDKMGNVHYKTLTDEYAFTGAGVVVTKANAFTKGSNLLGKWTDDDGSNLGSINTWGDR